MNIKTIDLRGLCAWENVALFMLCVADMVSTLYWIHSGVAEEANPIFAGLLHHGDFAFCAFKFISFMPLIATATYYRGQRPRLIAAAMRFTLVAYIVLYGGRFAAQALYGG